MVQYYDKQESGTKREDGLGLIHVNYGPGVGKTTRSVGLAVRAAQAGLRVHFVQFMKSGDSSEAAHLERTPNVTYHCPGKHPFVIDQKPEPVHFEHAAQALKSALEAAEQGVDLLICDEILNTLLFGVLTNDQVLDLIGRCRNRVELVMTGSSAPPEIIAASDYATEFVQIKHPYYSGARARKGIEF